LLTGALRKCNLRPDGASSAIGRVNHASLQRPYAIKCGAFKISQPVAARAPADLCPGFYQPRQTAASKFPMTEPVIAGQRPSPIAKSGGS